MNCAKCGVSVMGRVFSRVNPIGEKGIWWCEYCLKKFEPELFKNQIEDEPEIVGVLKDICCNPLHK